MGHHKGMTDTTDFGEAKRYAIKAAEELLYGDDVIENLKRATTGRELNRIMKSARLRGE